jgi:hypothetical protein
VEDLQCSTKEFFLTYAGLPVGTWTGKYANKINQY